MKPIFITNSIIHGPEDSFTDEERSGCSSGRPPVSGAQKASEAYATVEVAVARSVAMLSPLQAESRTTRGARWCALAPGSDSRVRYFYFPVLSSRSSGNPPTAGAGAANRRARPRRARHGHRASTTYSRADLGFIRPVALTGASHRSTCSFLDSWYCSNGGRWGSVFRCRRDIQGTQRRAWNWAFLF